VAKYFAFISPIIVWVLICKLGWSWLAACTYI